MIGEKKERDDLVVLLIWFSCKMSQEQEIKGEVVEAVVSPVAEKEEKKKRKRKQDNPKYCPPLEAEGNALSFPVAKKSKKYESQKEEAEQVAKFLKRNEKALKQEKVLTVKPVLEDFEKELANPDIKKAYLLTAFHFLNEYQLRITAVYDWENTCVQITDVAEKLERLSKMPPDLRLSEDALKSLDEKYNRKYWKVPRKDFAKIKALLKEKGEAIAVLYDLDLEEFPNRQAEGEVRCLVPKVRYE